MPYSSEIAQRSANQEIPNERSQQSQNNNWMGDSKRYTSKNAQD